MHPVLVQLATPFGTVPVYAYGVSLGLAVLVGWYVTLGLAGDDGRDAKTIADAYLCTLIGALLGARALYLVAHPSALRSIGSALAIHTGGMIGVGAVGGGLAALVAFANVRKLRILPLGDFLAPSGALAFFFVRIGCYLYGCCYGSPLGPSAPAFVRSLGTFPRIEHDGAIVGSPAFLHQIASETIALAPSASHSVPVHPTELYEAVLALVLFVVSFVALRHRRFSGQAFLVTMIGYSVVRLGIEPLRGDPGRGFALGLSYTQLAAVVMLVYAVLTYLNVRPDARSLPLASRGGRPA